VVKPKRDISDVGVLVGRFQVAELHEGHKCLIQDVLDDHEKVVIFLGLSPCRVTRNNPLDFESRKQMILAEFPDVIVLYIKDSPSDRAWSKNLDEQISDIVGPTSTVTLYGGRESFIDHYYGRHSTCEIEQEIYVSGTQERKKVSVKTKGSDDFRAGVIWAAYNQYPKAIPTIDVAIWDSDKKRLLMAKKPNEPLYRFVGGFAQGQGTYESEARREVSEEAHVEISDPQYVGSHVIDDWRYRRELDNIVTILFESIHVFGKPIPDDDICELRWFDVNKIKETDLVPAHRPLLKMLFENTNIGMRKDKDGSFIISEDKIDLKEEGRSWKRFNEDDLSSKDLFETREVIDKIKEKPSDIVEHISNLANKDRLSVCMVQVMVN